MLRWAYNLYTNLNAVYIIYSCLDNLHNSVMLMILLKSGHLGAESCKFQSSPDILKVSGARWSCISPLDPKIAT